MDVISKTAERDQQFMACIEANTAMLERMMGLLSAGFEKLGVPHQSSVTSDSPTSSSSAASSPNTVAVRAARQPRRRNRSKINNPNLRIVEQNKIPRRVVVNDPCVFCEKVNCESSSPTQCALQLTWQKRCERQVKYGLCPNQTCLNSHSERCSKIYTMKCTICSGPHHLVWCKTFCDLSEQRQYYKDGATKFAEHVDDYLARQNRPNQ